MQPVIMKPLFGGRTVPGVRFEDGEKVQGSRAILRALEQRVPSPPLYAGRGRAPRSRRPSAGATRSSSRSRAACCGRPSPRTRAPCTASRRARAARADAAGRLSPRPSSCRSSAAQRRRRRSIRADLAALPAHLDRIDQYIADGVLDGEQPNAADLQIAPGPPPAHDRGPRPADRRPRVRATRAAVVPGVSGGHAGGCAAAGVAGGCGALGSFWLARAGLAGALGESPVAPAS